MTEQRKPPVHIPLDFKAAIGGLLKVDPAQMPKKPAAKKAASKKPVAKKKA